MNLPKHRALKNMWCQVSKKEHSSCPWYKAPLFLKGFNQRRGIIFYDKNFSPVVKISPVRVVLWLLASLDLEVEQMYLKTVFLHRRLGGRDLHGAPNCFAMIVKQYY